MELSFQSLKLPGHFAKCLPLASSPTELERLAHRPSNEPAEPARAVQLFLAETDRVTRRARELFDEIVVAAAEPARDHGAESCDHGLDPD
jgi:hypothetical protein